MGKYFFLGITIVVVAVAGFFYFGKSSEEKSVASKDDLIVLYSPAPGSTIQSPIRITGKARGNWFFEASFPIFLTDWDGKIIATTHADALKDWMTTEYVPFEAEIKFDRPVFNRGTLVLKKDNPSGLPEHDNALEISVFFK